MAQGRTGRRGRLKARREELCISMAQVARGVGVDPKTVWRWENGRSDPYLRQYPALCATLRWPLGNVDELLVRENADDPAPGAVAASGSGSVAAASNDIDRRDRLADRAYVDSLREGTQQLVRLNDQYGCDDLVKVATRAFRTSYRRLSSGSYSDRVKRDLQAAVGEAGELAAWMAYDANDQELSRSLNHEALLISRLAGDRQMELFELANLAMQDIHLRRPAEAMGIADHALEGRLSPRTAALFHIRHARGRGQLGEKRAALAELGRARALLNDGISSNDPPWTWWIDNYELNCHEAMFHADLGDWPAAIDQFAKADELRPGGRDDRPRARYYDLAALLVALVAVGAWQDAEATMAEAATYIPDVASARTTVLLLQAIDTIQRGHSAPPTLTDHAEVLRQLLTA